MSANYIYYYKTDSSCEPIGRVSANDIEDAIDQITIIKHLSRDLIAELFIVERVNGGRYENNV